MRGETRSCQKGTGCALRARAGPADEGDRRAVLQRVMAGLMREQRILALNDEADHGYRERQPGRKTKVRSRATTARRPKEMGGGADLDIRARGCATEARLANSDRTVGHAIFPARFRLRGGDAASLDGERLLADGRHRVRHREAAARARGRQNVTGADVPKFRNLWEHIRPKMRNRACGNPLARPRTLLIDSEQVDSGDALDKTSGPPRRRDRALSPGDLAVPAARAGTRPGGHARARRLRLPESYRPGGRLNTRRHARPVMMPTDGTPTRSPAGLVPFEDAMTSEVSHGQR